jgi:uncharacterized protein YwqG
MVNNSEKAPVKIRSARIKFYLQFYNLFIKFLRFFKQEKCVTKFGGQPFRLNQSDWPKSKETGNPMQFICQVVFDEELFPGSKGKIAYIFMTAEEDYVDDTWEPDGGENAVIISSIDNKIDKSLVFQGPTLEEYQVGLQIKAEPKFEISDDESSDTEYDEYDLLLQGNKIGGTPSFIQGEEFSEREGWQLLLQIDSTQVPFYINFGDAGVGYIFVNKDCTVGKFIWQCH